MSRGVFENYLTVDNGCRILECSSQNQKSPAANILNDNPKQLWLINDALPQQCIIDCTAIRQFPRVYNRVGFYCWHEYDSNPALIEVAYKNTSDQAWTVAGTLRLERTNQKQYFKIKDIPATQMKLFRIIIKQNHAEKPTSLQKTTYLNQLELGYLKDPAAIQGRDRTISQFAKLTSAQKQLKKSQEQVRRMAGQQQELKAIVEKQQQLIIDMQENMKKMGKEIQKLRNIQEHQQIQIGQLQQAQNHRQQWSDQQPQPQSRQQQPQPYSKYQQPQPYSKYQQPQPQSRTKYIEDNLINQQAVGLVNSIAINRSQRHSHQQTKQKHNQQQSKQKHNQQQSKQKHNQQQSKIKQSAARLKSGTAQSSTYKFSQVDSREKQNKGRTQGRRGRESRQRVDSDLSDYQHSEEERASRYSEKCSEMMVRLQKLLAQRSRRQLQLKRRSENRN